MNLEKVIIEHALHLEFPAINNETEYEALITRLEVARELGVQDLKVYSNSQLVIRHIKGDCKALEENMVKYH